jgi:hypothetical protein
MIWVKHTIAPRALFLVLQYNAKQSFTRALKPKKYALGYNFFDLVPLMVIGGLDGDSFLARDRNYKTIFLKKLRK